jgi:hypothetical protein
MPLASHRTQRRAGMAIPLPDDPTCSKWMAQTDGLGLQDPAVKRSLRPKPGVTAHLDVHAFSAATRGFLTTRRLADEVDLAVAYRVSPALGLSTGYAYVHPLDGIREIGALERDGGWAWLMLDASF